MQRERTVKVKEAITTLCNLLSALGVESVPKTEAFRKAKFNKTDATQDVWQLLHSLLKKLFERGCICQESPHDSHLGFVRSAMWHTGYGAWWVTKAQACTNEIGSRDLLLALGWIMSSENLLELLLGEKFLLLEVLSSTPRAVLTVENLNLECLNGSGVDQAEREDLRTLQWQYGKLRLQWRNLLAAQQEHAKLTHKVLSNICPSSISEARLADVPKSTGSTGLDKDLECIRFLNGILKAYLEWKVAEPLFWCWMDSVIDGHLLDNCREGSTNVSLKEQAGIQSHSHDDKARRSLDKMVLRLQRELQLRRVEQTPYKLAHQDRHVGATQLSQEQKEEVERRVAARLQGLSLANSPTATSRGFIPYLQEPQASLSTSKLRKGELNQGMTSEKLQELKASSALSELKEREAVLQWELELLRQSHRVKMQEQANAIEGLVLIPPLKR